MKAMFAHQSSKSAGLSQWEPGLNLTDDQIFHIIMNYCAGQPIAKCRGSSLDSFNSQLFDPETSTSALSPLCLPYCHSPSLHPVNPSIQYHRLSLHLVISPLHLFPLLYICHSLTPFPLIWSLPSQIAFPSFPPLPPPPITSSFAHSVLFVSIQIQT